MPNRAWVTGTILSVLAVIAPTVSAQGGAASPGQSAFSRSSIDRSVARSSSTTRAARFSSLPFRTAAHAQQPPSDPAGEPGKFFASRKGIVVLAVLGAGIGYGIYSKIHDRLHSANPDR